MKTSKSYDIPKLPFVKAFKGVKANRGAPGVDGQSIEMFERDLENNLYKLWNRMSSGSYFPSAVRLCEIPKPYGSRRTLGIPTVSDRVAQMVVKQVLEPRLEGIFSENSYGYRPGKSAVEAVGQARSNCWAMYWVIDMDIKGFFDTIDHGLMLKALKSHAQEKWIHLYVERWLKAPGMAADGKEQERECGTPQGGVISPLLANLFLHYAMDKWLEEQFSGLPFERYADDIIIHCYSEKQARYVLHQVRERLEECGLSLNEKKTKIVFCKDGNRRGRSKHEKFEFLGFEFRPRLVRNSKDGHFFVSFSPAISPKSAKSIREQVRSWKLTKRVPLTLKEIAKEVNPAIRGWFTYYGNFCPYMLSRLKVFIDRRLAFWTMRKFKSLHRRFVRALRWLWGIRREHPQLFAHWA